MLTYLQAIDVLNVLIDQSRTYPAEYAISRINAVHRTQQLLNALDSPHAAYPIIHITGTKGKGSVAAMTAAILQAAGYRVGLYTSPHLQDFRERFQVNGHLADGDVLAALISQMQFAMNDIPYLRWFEAVTALALAYFRHECVDVAVVEVGVGGLVDATNVVQPTLSIITSISYDHTAVLGDTLTDIATEKAGIIKPHIPVISAPQAREAHLVLQAAAERQQAPLHFVGRDSRYFPMDASLLGQAVEVVQQDGSSSIYKTSLVGKHQAINAAVVVAAMRQLCALGWHINERDIHEGLRSVQWPARFEVIDGSPQIIIDAAHNQASAGWLAKTLQQLFPDHSLTVVFGAMSDKDVTGMLGKFVGQADHFIFTQARSGRALSPEQLYDVATAIGIADAHISLAHTVATALDIARRMDTQLVCMTGSLYVVGEARDVLGLQAVPLVAIGGQQAE